MKLRGILDSKGRREAWQRNLEPAGPDRLPPVEHVHQSRPGAGGTIYCCSGRYSPAAHKLHVQNEPLSVICSGVAVSGLDDQWLTTHSNASNATPELDSEALQRQIAIDLYFEQRKKATARRVSGADHWMGEG